MKTVQDLVDKLNETKEDEGIYYLSEKHKGMFTVDYKLCGESWSIVIFDKRAKVILLTTNKSLMNWQEMYWISKYALEHPYKDWFPEKKYNIIIGRDSDNNHLTAYYKSTNDNYRGYTSSFASCCDLKNKVYIFSESEVEELKSTLPENMAKIVELGKVEVEDD
ncbi:hypothetical protein NX776_00475 [Apilactobacillus kunkeei]|uniref:hypothetical protein n=1 Tax=Apilactobacillus kunkeei TaxID=148814 RepID=UPI0026588DDD|nr:hypothetical protein [Apilactobacillus kunkeei]MCX0325192.1 hypothetical protein [Apilactobacillus kunkeei]